MTREEAIEVYNGLINTKIKEAFEFFAPELAESEDERIRETIESIIRVYGKTQGEWIAGYDMDTLVVHLRNAFAYLEKQKELHFGYPGLYFYDGEKLHFQGNPAMEEKQKDADIVQYEEGYNYGYLKGIEVGWQDSLKKQKEQKPVTKDGQQECPYKDLALVKDFFGKYKRKCKLSNKACDSKECEQWNELQAEFKRINEAFENGKNEVINRPEVFGLQKPAEWSEGDENCIRNLESIIYYDKNLPTDTRIKLGDFLKSLRPQQKKEIEICPHSVKSKSYSEAGYPIEDCDYGLEIAADILRKTRGKVQGYQSDDGLREHDTAIAAVENADKSLRPVKQEWSEDIIREGVKQVGLTQHQIEWIRSHCSPQPKQEWGEEDEEMLEYIIGDVNDAKQLYTTQEAKDFADKEITWLKSLRPQPKEEWSKEDKIDLNDTIKYIQNYGETSSDEYARLRTKEIVDWLKSLPYRFSLSSWGEEIRDAFFGVESNWKPSEEQMEALMRAITWLVEAGNHTDSSILANLRSHLKELM